MNYRPNEATHHRSSKPDVAELTQPMTRGEAVCPTDGPAAEPAIRLHIASDGRIRGLWNEVVNFSALGRMHITRASHVEFDERCQQWFVREAVPASWARRLLQVLTGRPWGRVLCTATTRSAALEWESSHFSPGGPGWSAFASRLSH